MYKEVFPYSMFRFGRIGKRPGFVGRQPDVKKAKPEITDDSPQRGQHGLFANDGNFLERFREMQGRASELDQQVHVSQEMSTVTEDKNFMYFHIWNFYAI